MTSPSSIPFAPLAPALPAPIPRFELIGAPALDFTGYRLLPGIPLPAALAAYPDPVDSAFRHRMGFFARLIPYHEVRFGLDTHQPDHLAHGLAAINKCADAE
jgi:hypothetical protein